MIECRAIDEFAQIKKGMFGIYGKNTAQRPKVYPTSS